MSAQDEFYELSYYTLAQKGKNFIHQHIADAYTAQTAIVNTKPIAIFFSLAGLYLLIEKKYTGRQVQQAHLQMAKKTKIFPNIVLPENRGCITVTNVLNAAPGATRDEMIQKWCISVWNAFSDQQDKIILFTDKLLEK